MFTFNPNLVQDEKNGIFICIVISDDDIVFL